MLSTGTPQKFGYTGYISAALTVFGLALLLQARSEDFTHGAELAWALAYLIPLFLAFIGLVLGGIHLFRGRTGSLVAWVPVATSLALVAWLIAYLYFGAFRSA